MTFIIISIVLVFVVMPIVSILYTCVKTKRGIEKGDFSKLVHSGGLENSDASIKGATKYFRLTHSVKDFK